MPMQIELDDFSIQYLLLCLTATQSRESYQETSVMNKVRCIETVVAKVHLSW